MRKTIIERFEKKIERLANDCWLWTGACNGDLPIFAPEKGKTVTGARFAYESYRGPIPLEHSVVPCCGERRCVNPEHLVAVPRRRALSNGAPYPDAMHRQRALKMLRWLRTMYPPLKGDVDSLLVKVTAYGQRRPLLWRPEDFRQASD